MIQCRLVDQEAGQPHPAIGPVKLRQASFAELQRGHALAEELFRHHVARQPSLPQEDETLSQGLHPRTTK